MAGSAGLSRRQVLRRAGVAAGAAAGAAVLPAGGLAAQEPSFDPTLMSTDGPVSRSPGEIVAAAPPPLNPAFTYLTVPFEAFQVLGSGGTLTTDNNGLHASTSTNLRAPLQLPHGASLQEVTFFVFNSSANLALAIGVVRFTPPSMVTTSFLSFTQPNQGSHTVTIAADLFGDLNPLDMTASSYGLLAFLTGGVTHGLFGARVAYTPPPVPAPPPPPGLFFVPLAVQKRKLDTRDPGPLTSKIASGQTRVLPLAPELPAGAAKAALVNLTITETEDSGFLALFPGGTPYAGTSSINWSSSGLNLANSAVVAVPASGEVAILAGGGGRTHVVVDLLGYFV